MVPYNALRWRHLVVARSVVHGRKGEKVGAASARGRKSREERGSEWFSTAEAQTVDDLQFQSELSLLRERVSKLLVFFKSKAIISIKTLKSAKQSNTEIPIRHYFSRDLSKVQSIKVSYSCPLRTFD